MALNIPIILGTAREGRQSERVAAYVLGEARKAGFESELIDVREYAINATDNTGEKPVAKKFAAKIAKADALVVVSPEYNHGYPGELKLLLDMCYNEYARKPLGICGVSAGGLGGARAVEQLRQVAVELHMVPIREALYFPDVYELFDERGKVKERGYAGRVAKFFDELAWYAGALKAAREKGER